jgi:antitoxin component of MazEF toxin-antitoxin module
MVTYLTKIGNSYGVILNKKMLQQAGVLSSKEVNIEVKDGAIVIAPVSKEVRVNLDRSSWDAEFKNAIKAGRRPERSIWPDEVNTKTDKDWTW